MINFRYHVVSLTAVFLALAIGLVVGTAALNGPVADSLSDNVNGLRKDNQQLRDTVNSLKEEVNREEDFASEAAQLLLPGKLADKRVLLVVLPSGGDQVDGVNKMLTTAGAKVTGRVEVQDKFVNPDNSIELLDLAVRASQPTVPTAKLPGNSDGVETSSALLATALLDRPQGTAPVSEADLKAVLSAYSNAGYITVEGKLVGPAEIAVVISGQPYVDRDSAKKDAAVVTMVDQFDKAGRVVVAGTGSSAGNVVAGVRSDPALSKTISTVDNANTAQGQVVTTLAAAEQVASNKTGHYGLGEGATSLMPKQAG
ncbi:Copper transport outer membrane protein, MctB [Micromonospora pattaloongensis]|uniref:Copper transport outer membrane protein, MctB n=1 Tax=Micromonospora pattaloongensis TaxID=405436 RepID=A0A1H3T0M2_9ACTN|nr:copper transporter [Micromonospora pattaloongensis]SDZ43903.1 Copper transport outer membrane protein, MctB [Micromonospora pattaloongensis]